MLSAGEIESLKNDLREFYNKFPRYTILGSFYQVTKLSSDINYINFVMKYIEPEMKILDVGTGAGILTMEMARLAKEIIGIDISSCVVDFASKLKLIEIKRYKLIEDYQRKNYSTDKINKTTFSVGDTEALSFKDNTFDLIVAQDMIEHLPAPIKALNEMLRCVKPGGKVIIILHTPNIDINLNIESWKADISKMKNKDAVSKMNYNVLKSWFNRKQINIVDQNITYNSKVIKLFTKFCFWTKGAPFLERYEDTIVFVLEKSPPQTPNTKAIKTNGKNKGKLK